MAGDGDDVVHLHVGFVEPHIVELHGAGAQIGFLRPLAMGECRGGGRWRQHEQRSEHADTGAQTVEDAHRLHPLDHLAAARRLDAHQ
jgi:hypothetical protein